MSDSVQVPPAPETGKHERHWLPFVHRNGHAPASEAVAGSVYFADLVHSHYEWRRAVEDGLPAADLKQQYLEQLNQFQEKYGEIVNAYWCLEEPSAVALTEKRRARWLRPRLRFHRVTDWATREKPALAAGLHKCDELAIRATEVLWGMRERIALQMITASAAHLLSAADSKATEGHAVDIHKQELDAKKGMLRRCEDYYCDAANGQAQMVYFLGMAGVAAVLAAAAGLTAYFASLPLDEGAFFGALIAGSLGALVSVVARVNSGRFDLEYDVGFTYPFFLGGLRPLMGAIFGLGVFFAIDSGLLAVPKLENANDLFAAIIVLAFVAGFSERWAKDTLAAAAGEPAKKAPAKEAA